MPTAGRYTVRSEWQPRRSGDQFIAGSVVEIDADGVVVVWATDDEPLFAFASADEFFEAFGVTPSDLIADLTFARRRSR